MADTVVATHWGPPLHSKRSYFGSAYGRLLGRARPHLKTRTEQSVPLLLTNRLPIISTALANEPDRAAVSRPRAKPAPITHTVRPFFCGLHRIVRATDSSAWYDGRSHSQNDESPDYGTG